MPVEVVGLKEAQKAMRALQPTLEKELKKEIRFIMKPIIATARGYVKDSPLAGIPNWSAHNNGKWKNIQFNASKVRRGINVQFSPTKRKSGGFVSLVRLVNNTAAGAIYETAGRKIGQDSSPKSIRFVNSIGGILKGRDLLRGRVIYRAMAEDQGLVVKAILRAINNTSKKTVAYVDAAKAFRSAA
jgi:hypothetical protein